MLKKISAIILGLLIIMAIPSCNHNKIACPTYADSFPNKKKKKGSDKPDIPKASRPKLSIAPPGYKGN